MKLLAAEAQTADKGLVMRICCISDHLLTGGMLWLEMMVLSSTFGNVPVSSVRILSVQFCGHFILCSSTFLGKCLQDLKLVWVCML